MPFTFIAAIFFVALTVVAVFIWKFASPVPERTGRDRYSDEAFPLKTTAGFISLAVGGLAALFLLVSSWNQVTTQNVGIETSFGRPVGHLSNGLHFTPPWYNVTEMDGSIQTDTFESANCIPVRIAEQQTACATVSIRWRMRPVASDLLFRNYHTFEGIRDSLVHRELAVAMNEQFANYNPIASLTSAQPAGSTSNPTVSQLAVKVSAQMISEIGSQILVSNVLIPQITYDAAVQNRINTVLAQTAQTDVAQQAIKTALAQSQANKDLAASVSGNPGVLQSQCLNLVNEGIKAGYQFPAGFSCFGSSSVGVIAK